MKSSRKFWIGGTALVAAALMPLAALAAHGKAGLWKVTSTMHMGGMQMPTLSPQQMAQMKAMGVHIPTSHSFTMQRCMTQAEVDADVPPNNQRPQSGCKVTGTHVSGHTMSADMVCNGQMKGHGHFHVTYDNPEHYKGRAPSQA